MTEQLQKQQQYGYSLLYTFMRYHVFLHWQLIYICIANMLRSKIPFQRKLNLSASKAIKPSIW